MRSSALLSGCEVNGPSRPSTSGRVQGRLSTPTCMPAALLTNRMAHGLRSKRVAPLQALEMDSQGVSDVVAGISGSAAQLGSDAVAVTDGAQGLLGVIPAEDVTALQPLLDILGSDFNSFASFSPTSAAIFHFAAIYYFFLTKPNPFLGVLDYFVVGPLLDQTSNKFASRSFAIRDRMGGGNFGVAYEGLKLVPGEKESSIGRGGLSDEQKKRRVVLKRVNNGGGVRSDFLKGGTLAKGASETGKVESYMCSKIKRNPVVSSYCANFQGYFIADEQVGAFTKGSQWLVWNYESDATVGDALNNKLGEYPACLDAYVMGGRGGSMDSEKRNAQIIKNLMKQVLKGLQQLHSLGIVHRDVKPENLLLTADGKVKFIDFGAAVDMCTGVNFNPEFGMLDPRYSPPEELVMPKSFPRAPSPLVAAVLSPFAWFYARPDLFDSYSAGVMLMQLSVPQLHSGANVRNFNNELKQYDWDLKKWRASRGSKFDFTLLDRNGGAGFDLACRLLCKRDSTFRGRLSVSRALLHRYFLPEF